MGRRVSGRASAAARLFVVKVLVVLGAGRLDDPRAVEALFDDGDEAGEEGGVVGERAALLVGHRPQPLGELIDDGDLVALRRAARAGDQLEVLLLGEHDPLLFGRVDGEQHQPRLALARVAGDHAAAAVELGAVDEALELDEASVAQPLRRRRVAALLPLLERRVDAAELVRFELQQLRALGRDEHEVDALFRQPRLGVAHLLIERRRRVVGRHADPDALVEAQRLRLLARGGAAHEAALEVADRLAARLQREGRR